jgi:DNA-binding HxlR family transcriptional regulator
MERDSLKGLENMNNLINLKGTKEILKSLENKECTWTELLNSCDSAISQRAFYIRIKQLRDSGFINTKTTLKDKRVKIYFLTEEGRELLELI